MLFNSFSFVIFFAIVLTLYWLLHRDYRWQNALLLIASYFFYGAWNWKFLFLLWGSTAVDFLAGIRMGSARTPGARRGWLLTSLGYNLSMLGFFKYFNFGVETLAVLLRHLGFEPHLPTLNVILPVGISFYTFQSIGYTLDVYRGRREPIRDPLAFAVYVAYFPQLVAGPIERSTTLPPQFMKPRHVTVEDLRVGFEWILLGYFKKVVIADTLAPMVNYVFDNPGRVSGAVSLVGICAFALQIYGDFAGYTFIARGISKWMGIHLVQNFRRPYFARDPRDFWTRWHISLSTWLRDYLYISLGGNRKGEGRTYLNLMITMLLGGLWHGARWNFVLWGAYHGALLVICHALRIGRDDRPLGAPATLARIAFTFVLTLGGWLLFRVSSMDHLTAVVRNIVTNFHAGEDMGTYLRPVVTMFTLLVAYHVWQERRGDEFVLLHANQWLRYGTYLFAVLAIMSFRFTPVAFIYFQF